MSSIGQNKIADGFITFVFAVIFVIVVGILVAFPIKWMVNYVFAPSFLSSVFGMGQIDVWHALWLTVLCGWLFSGSKSGSNK